MNELYISDSYIYFKTNENTYSKAMNEFFEKCEEAGIEISIDNAKLRNEDGNEIG